MSNTRSGFQFYPDFSGFSDKALKVEVPTHLDVLPNGQEILIAGYPFRQNDTPYSSRDSITLNVCEYRFRQFNLLSNEIDLTNYTLQHGYCHLTDVPRLAISMTLDQNAEKLWNFGHGYYSDETNQVIVASHVARNRISAEIRGFYVYDVLVDAADNFVDSLTMQQAWLDVGGQPLVADGPSSTAHKSV